MAIHLVLHLIAHLVAPLTCLRLVELLSRAGINGARRASAASLRLGKALGLAAEARCAPGWGMVLLFNNRLHDIRHYAPKV